MKKLLAMVLALVMTLSLAVSANAFTDDKSISDDYAEAVAVLNGMGVFKGYEDGTFKPSGNVTGYEVLAMILRAVGYDKNNEFSGADWALHVAQTAQQAGVLKNVKGIGLNAPATRELVAELLFRAIAEAFTVNYTPDFGYVTDKVIGTKTNSLGEKNFKLNSKDTADKWGRPGTLWTYNTGDKATTFVEKPDVSYTKAVAECDVAHDAGLTADTAYALYVNGDLNATKYTVNLTDTTTKMGAQGRLVEVYDDVIVMIDTFLAKVTSVSDATYDAQGHLRKEASITLLIYDGTSNKELTLTTGAQSVIYWNAQQHNVEGTVYDDAVKFCLDQAGNSTENHTWFLDQYGNLIGAADIAATDSYGVINRIWWVGNTADGTGLPLLT